MTKLNYMASRIKQLVSLLKSNSENKAYKDAQYMNLSLCLLGQVPTLLMQTGQPSFDLQLCKPLLDEESARQGDVQIDCQTDNKQAWRVETEALERALACCRQRDTEITLADDGTIALGTELNTLTLEAQVMSLKPIHSVVGETTVTLKTDCLLRALSAALEVASVRGNDLEKSGIHLVYWPAGLRVEGANPQALCITEYGPEVWTQPHTQQGEAVLTTDAVRHLVRCLSAVEQEQTHLNLGDDILEISNGQMQMLADLQPINYFDSSYIRTMSRPCHYGVSRRDLLQALYSLRMLGEKQVRLSCTAHSMLLQHVDTTRTTCQTTLECVPTLDTMMLEDRLLPIAPLLVPLSTHLLQEGCTLAYSDTDKDVPLCLTCGETRVFVR